MASTPTILYCDFQKAAAGPASCRSAEGLVHMSYRVVSDVQNALQAKKPPVVILDITNPCDLGLHDIDWPLKIICHSKDVAQTKFMQETLGATVQVYEITKLGRPINLSSATEFALIPQDVDTLVAIAAAFDTKPDDVQHFGVPQAAPIANAASLADSLIPRSAAPDSRLGIVFLEATSSGPGIHEEPHACVSLAWGPRDAGTLHDLFVMMTAKLRPTDPILIIAGALALDFGGPRFHVVLFQSLQCGAFQESAPRYNVDADEPSLADVRRLAASFNNGASTFTSSEISKALSDTFSGGRPLIGCTAGAPSVAASMDNIPLPVRIDSAQLPVPQAAAVAPSSNVVTTGFHTVVMGAEALTTCQMNDVAFGHMACHGTPPSTAAARPPSPIAGGSDSEADDQDDDGATTAPFNPPKSSTSSSEKAPELYKRPIPPKPAKSAADAAVESVFNAVTNFLAPVPAPKKEDELPPLEDDELPPLVENPASRAVETARRVTLCHPDGTPKKVINTRDNVAHGLVAEYYPSGILASQYTYATGVLDGPFSTFNQDGSLHCSGSYSKGLRDGNWSTTCGMSILVERYEKGVKK
jgi:hypothetical protein